MSLINDVLRDLERRGAQGPRPLPAAPLPPRPSRRWIWWLGVAVLAGVIMHFLYYGIGERRALPGDRLASVQPVSTDASIEAAKDPLTPLLPRPATAMEVEAEPQQPDRPTPGVAMTMQDVAEASPSPVEPRASRRSASGTGESGNPVDGLAQSSETVTTVQPDSQPVAPTLSQAGEVGPESARRSGAGAAADGARDDGQIVIRRSGPSRPGAEDMLLSARRAVARGQRELAVSRLYGLLQEQPGHAEARLLLARTLIELGRHSTADQILETGLALQPDESRYAFLRGRLLMEQGRIGSARSLLIRHAPDVAADPDYHLLLAAVHRQVGEHAAAADTYRAVTQAHPALGKAWVGLGVSLESEGDSQGARLAYREALRADDRRAAAFARQRLAVMPPPAAKDD